MNLKPYWFVLGNGIILDLGIDPEHKSQLTKREKFETTLYWEAVFPILKSFFNIEKRDDTQFPVWMKIKNPVAYKNE